MFGNRWSEYKLIFYNILILRLNNILALKIKLSQALFKNLG